MEKRQREFADRFQRSLAELVGMFNESRSLNIDIAFQINPTGFRGKFREENFYIKTKETFLKKVRVKK